jgi:hypothetical protein
MTTIEAQGPESRFFEAGFFSVIGGDGKEEAFSASALSSSSEEINVSIGFMSGNPVYNRVVFGSRILTQLIIGSGSC